MYRVVSPDHVKVVSSSFLKIVNDSPHITLTSCYAQEATSFMMDSFNNLWSKVKYIIIIVASPAESDSCYSFNFVHLFQKNN